MDIKKHISIETVLKISLSFMLIFSGICLIYGCLSIYYSSEDNPYTREIVAKTFKQIAAPIFITLGLIVITALIDLFNNSKAKKLVSSPSAEHILKMYFQKRDLSNDNALTDKIELEQKKRRINNMVKYFVYLISAVIFLIYALNPSNFHRSEINSSMIKAMWVLIPCLALSFIASITNFIVNQKIIKREIEFLKTAPLKQDNSTQDKNSGDKKLRIIKLVLIIVFASLAIIGFIMGGTADVLTKAVNICTECIGLG